MEDEGLVTTELSHLSETDAETECLRRANLQSLTRIGKLQAQIGQMRQKLAANGKDLEAARRRVKGELAVGRNIGLEQMSQGVLSDILEFICLLEEENRGLRELSTIPMEIEKLKAEVGQRKQSRLQSPEHTSGTQSLVGLITSEVAQLRAEVSDFRQRLTEETVARAQLQSITVPTLQSSKAALEREVAALHSELRALREKEQESLVSFQSVCKAQFRKEAPLATGRRQYRTSVAVPFAGSSSANKEKKTSVYAPTFLRTPRARKRPKAKSVLFAESPPDSEAEPGGN